MSVREMKQRPRFMPVLVLALGVMVALKAANFWIGLSEADAAQNAGQDPARDFAQEEGAPIVLTSLEKQKQAPREASALEASQSPSERRLLVQLAERRAELDEREKSLETREKLLEVAEARFSDKIVELKDQRAALAALTAEHAQAEEEEFEALSNAYERMKAKDAARIFEVMDNDILTPVAAGMRTQSLALVLAEMQPEKARALTRELAGRARREAKAPAQAGNEFGVIGGQ